MPSVDIPPMSYGLSEDSRRLTLKFDGAAHDYTVEQVETLMHFLYLRRAQMLPSVAPSFDQVPPDRVLCADAYQVKVDPENRSALVWMQLAGYGWAVAEIPATGTGELWRELLELSSQGLSAPGRTDIAQ